jgi:hypothetical protein
LTSTADLEETIAAMFLPPDNVAGEASPVTPVKLSGATQQHATNSNDVIQVTGRVLTANLSGDMDQESPDNLTADRIIKELPSPPDSLTSQHSPLITPSPQDILTGGSADKLTSVAEPMGERTRGLHQYPPDILTANLPGMAPPPDKLSGILFETLDGLVVDGACIRPYETVQNAHTASEHLVYMAMWKMLGSREQDGSSREGILPMRAVAGKVSLSLRNLRRVLRSLEQKLAIEITGYEDKTRSIPRRYRVWGVRPTIDRRRRAGYTYIYKYRNLITLARPFQSPDKVTGGHQTN